MARSPFSLPMTRETRTDGAAPSQRMLVLSFCLVLVGLLAGSSIALRWQEQATASPSSGVRQEGPALVAATINRLEAEQAELRNEIGALRDKMSAMQADEASSKSTLVEVANEITRQRVAAGLVPLAGPGVVARFNDSTALSVPANEDPANYILHDYDLRDVVNTLWAAGAEAISINDQRLVSTSSLYCVGTTIVFNVTRLSPPFVVTAIGNPDALEAALREAPQMAAFNQRALIYDLPQEIAKEGKVTVPAYDGSITFRYAEVSDESSGEPTLTPNQ